MGTYLKYVSLLSLIIGFGFANIKLKGESNTLGLLPFAYAYFSLRFMVMSFVTLGPLALIVWCLLPSSTQPKIGERFVYITFAAMLIALVLHVIGPEIMAIRNQIK